MFMASVVALILMPPRPNMEAMLLRLLFPRFWISGARVSLTAYMRFMDRALKMPITPNTNPMMRICFQCLRILVKIPAQSIWNSSSSCI